MCSEFPYEFIMQGFSMNICRSVERSFGALILTILIVMCSVMISSGKTKAAGKMVDLKPDMEEHTMDAPNNMVGIDFDIPEEYNSPVKLSRAGLKKLQVKYKVTDYSSPVGGVAGVRLFYVLGEAGEIVEVRDALVSGEEETMTLDLPDVSAAADPTINELGLQFINITGTITYKIISARLIDDEYIEEPEEIISEITVDKQSIILEKGDNARVSTDEDASVVMSVWPEGASIKDIVFSSSNNEIAIIDNKGNITAVDKGEAIITISSGNVESTFIVNVIDVLQDISVKEKPSLIDIGKLPGGTEYTDDNYPKNLYVTFVSGNKEPKVLLDKDELTLLLNPDYKLVGRNDNLTVTFNNAENTEKEEITDSIILSDVTVKAVEADVTVKISGNTVIKGDVNTKKVEIASGIVSVAGKVNSKDEVIITDGIVYVEDGINAGENVTVGAKTMLSVNVDKEDTESKSAISGTSITIEDGAAITAGDNVKDNLFSVIPKNEKGENIDISRYVKGKTQGSDSSGDKASESDKTSSDPENTGAGQEIKKDDNKQEVKQTEVSVNQQAGQNGVDTESSKQAAATDMILTADVKGITDVPVSGTCILAVKKSMTVKAAFSTEGAVSESITVASSDPKVVSVNGTKLTAKKSGKAKITVTSEKGLTKTFNVKVMKKSVSKLKIKASKKTVKAGKTIKLKTTITPVTKASNKVYWRSLDETVATVSNKGAVKGIKKGKVKITAIALDGSGRKSTVKLIVK